MVPRQAGDSDPVILDLWLRRIRSIDGTKDVVGTKHSQI